MASTPTSSSSASALSGNSDEDFEIIDVSAYKGSWDFWIGSIKDVVVYSDATLRNRMGIVQKIGSKIACLANSYFKSSGTVLNPSEEKRLSEAARRLNKKAKIGPIALSAFGAYLVNKARETSKKEEFSVLTQFLIEGTETDAVLDLLDCTKQAQTDKKLIAIPFVRRGFVDHIMCVILDRSKNILEFYDSYGVGYEESQNGKLLACPEQTIHDLIEGIKKKWSLPDNIEIQSNHYVHQYDVHNCGIYVCDYMWRRLLEGSYDFSKRLTFSASNGLMREKIMAQLDEDGRKRIEVYFDEPSKDLESSSSTSSSSAAAAKSESESLTAANLAFRETESTAGDRALSPSTGSSEERTSSPSTVSSSEGRTASPSTVSSSGDRAVSPSTVSSSGDRAVSPSTESAESSLSDGSECPLDDFDLLAIYNSFFGEE